MGTLLAIDNLHAGYGPIEVLKGISVAVGEHEIVTVIGANGAGKTTTLMCVSGVNHVHGGKIVFQGIEIQNHPPYEIVRLGICQSPEGRKVFPRLTVLENLEMGAYTRSDAAGIAADIDQQYDLFPILKERQEQLAGTLSGGEQQMLAVARALMGRPKLLLLDEPSLGLAPLIVKKIFDVIRRLNEEQGMAVLLVEQNARLALKLAHRGYVMETGSITLTGSGAELLEDPKVQEAYLGG
jgi:branched-chain amino acid transport system ATP-binding protein